MGKGGYLLGGVKRTKRLIVSTKLYQTSPVYMEEGCRTQSHVNQLANELSSK